MTPTILSIEDEQDTSALLKSVLERDGYHVVHAADGRQAICLIETMLPPALILLDVILPYVNGFELLIALRLNPDWKHVPIIMVSADSCAADIERALAHGATDYVVKTAGIEEVMRKVRRALSSVVVDAPPAVTEAPVRPMPTRPRRRTARAASVRNETERTNRMTGRTNASGRIILLVEDQEDTACLLEFVLQKNGYRVIHSNTGEHARRLITTMAPPDAVLLDVHLPDISGLDLLVHLREQEQWKNIPVAMLTADTDSLDMRRAALLGANDYIVKPVSPTQLATRLNRLLRGSHTRQNRVA